MLQKAMAAQREKEAAKKEAKLKAKGVIEKPTKKSKGFRLRKGAKIKGIIVTDSESKRKVCFGVGVSSRALLLCFASLRGACEHW
jgi:hypothetical protein